MRLRLLCFEVRARPVVRFRVRERSVPSSQDNASYFEPGRHYGAARSANSVTTVRANQPPRVVSRACALSRRTLSVSMPSRPRSATVAPEMGLSSTRRMAQSRPRNAYEDFHRSSRRLRRPALRMTEWRSARGAHRTQGTAMTRQSSVHSSKLARMV